MSTFVDELTEERGGGGIDGQNVVSYNNSSVSRYETTSVSSEESKARTNLINNERGLRESSRGPAAFNYFPSEICTAIREGNGRRYVGEEVVAGRQGHAKNIAPSFHLSSALAYI